MVLGAAGGVVGAFRPTPTTSTDAGMQSGSSPALGTVGLAELAARDWLATGQIDGPASESSAGGHLQVLATAVVEVRTAGPARWTVTVAAELQPPASAEAALWFVEVAVTETPEGLATGPPAIVAGPPRTTTPSRAAEVQMSRPAPDDPLAATAEQFLAALLSGGSDVSRYLAPGVSLQAVDPPPFLSVELEGTVVVARRPDGVVMRAVVLARTVDDVELRMVYELDLAERDGRWEVRRLGTAPAAAGEQPRSSSTTGTVPSTTEGPVPGT